MPSPPDFHGVHRRTGDADTALSLMARRLLIAVARQLPALTVGIVDEMMTRNESGLALETLSEMLLESGAVISGETLADISSLVDED